MSEGDAFVFHMVGDGIGDHFVLDVEEDSKILLDGFDNVFDIFVEGKDELKIHFVIGLDGFKHIPPTLPILLVQLLYLVGIEEIHCLIEKVN